MCRALFARRESRSSPARGKMEEVEGGGRREKESESKNPNKLPKDSAENARTTDRSLTCSDHCCRSNCHAGERNLIPRGGIY